MLIIKDAPKWKFVAEIGKKKHLALDFFLQFFIYFAKFFTIA